MSANQSLAAGLVQTDSKNNRFLFTQARKATRAAGF